MMDIGKWRLEFSVLPCYPIDIIFQDRVREFRRVYRQWSHLIYMKNLGRYGSNTSPLPFTVFCPACPQPGKNIPSNWLQDMQPKD
jgi:hypothetical protein